MAYRPQRCSRFLRPAAVVLPLLLAACGVTLGDLASDAGTDQGFVDPISCGVVDYCFSEQGGSPGFAECSNMYVSGAATPYRQCILDEGSTVGGKCFAACMSATGDLGAIGDAGAGELTPWGACADCLFGTSAGGRSGGPCSTAYQLCHPAPADGGPDPLACPATCGPCATNEVCISFFDHADPLWGARCLPRCTDDRDCVPGFVCMAVLNDSTTNPIPQACVRDNVPPSCGKPGGHCFDVLDRCLDDQTAAVATTLGNGLCGYEIAHCPKGCAGNRPTDMGLAVGGHCQ